MPTPRATRRGRRPGAPDTRATILTAARSAFAEKGLAGTTIRAVAAAAGVDAALVHHYFGTKDDLFLAAMELPVDPRQVIGPALAGGAEGAGERLMRVILSLWDDPAISPSLVGIVRSTMQPGGERLLTQGFVPVVLMPAGEALGIDRPQLRMPLVISQVAGLILTRYVIGLEPIASMPAETVVAAYAPVIQHYLTGDLGIRGER
ncbi:MAG TPA: TetR family transcriptional regulator [Nocardioides sp.]|uniref:TetR/AcrR family transcriptional regulator n=1 Tax=Nocardioides sp. TaxID=35761 RepID=UPI002F41E8E8